jgi:hypothetical protein
MRDSSLHRDPACDRVLHPLSDAKTALEIVVEAHNGDRLAEINGANATDRSGVRDATDSLGSSARKIPGRIMFALQSHAGNFLELPNHCRPVEHEQFNHRVSQKGCEEVPTAVQEGALLVLAKHSPLDVGGVGHEIEVRSWAVG